MTSQRERAAGRVLHAALALLDRQLVDRNGRLSGKVDDIELTEPDEHGHVHVSAILSGPGALLYRMSRRRSGRWLRRFAAHAFPDAYNPDDPVRIPIGVVSDIGNHITLALDREQLATFGGERWVRDHVIDHIPGSRHDAAE